jgi:predicted DCC family thiol-disulfide oxidoreductase YuxK
VSACHHPVMENNERWTVLYDGDCGFCKWVLAGLLKRDRERRMVPLALQHPDADPLLGDLSPEERMASLHLVTPSGERLSGGAAMPALLRLVPRGAPAAAALARVPKTTDRAYRWVADHRVHLSRPIPQSAKQKAGAYVRRREEELRRTGVAHR